MRPSGFVMNVPRLSESADLPHPRCIPKEILADRSKRWIVAAGCYDLGNYWGTFVFPSRFRWLALLKARLYFRLHEDIGYAETYWALVDLDKVRATRRIFGLSL